MINGIALVSGVEKLSYISPRYYGVRESYDESIAQTQGRVSAQDECAHHELVYQDARLNKAYEALTSTLKSNSIDAIELASTLDAQRAWIAFYQKDCAARAARFGSDAAPATESICLMENTARRAQELEDWRSSYIGSYSR